LHVYVRGKVNEYTGFVLDYADISRIIKPLIEDLDHKFLGQYYSPDHAGPVVIASANSHVPGLPDSFYPSSENLLFWIADQLPPTFCWSKLALEETCTSHATLTRKEYEEARKVRASDAP
jgi:6-pyruvoyltetrahydropterin/6-carboxytetrahydropterin synthase